MTTKQPIVVEQTFRVPVERVWRAITDADQMPKWFFENIRAFEPRVGFETSFNVHHDGRDFLHQWKVTEAVPPRRLVYDWNYGGVPGGSFVVWELAEAGGETRLTLTHTGIHTFPQDVPEFTRDSCEAGWRFFLCERLVAFLEQG